MKTSGFTLVEMVLVIMVIAIMTSMLGPTMVETMETYNLISSRKTMLGQMRAGFDRMVQEIRLIPGQAQIISTSASSFQFQYPTGTSITYSLSGTNLKRNSDILMQNVTGLAFIYYDQSGTATVTPANVRSVSLQVTATTSTSTTPYVVRTRVFIRNTSNHYAIFTSP